MLAIPTQNRRVIRAALTTLVVSAATVLGLPGRAAAAPSGPGLTAPDLASGQAWYVQAIEQLASPWQPPPGRRTPPGAAVPIPPPSLVPSSSAVVVTRFGVQTWSFPDGDGLRRGTQLGPSRFLGSPADRRLWRSKGAYPPLAASGDGFITGADGFPVGDQTLSLQQLQSFATTPAGVQAFLQGADPAGTNPFDTITQLLTEAPLPDASRSAVIGSLGAVPGVRLIGTVLDPLGRSGVAVAIDRTVPSTVITAAGPRRGPVTRVRSELIFGPSQNALLAQETLLLNPPHLKGITRPYPMQSIAYVSSSVVPATSAPGTDPPTG